MNKLINAVTNTLKRNAAYRQTVRELSALDTRQLSDLGITRADIAQLARGITRADIAQLARDNARAIY